MKANINYYMNKYHYAYYYDETNNKYIRYYTEYIAKLCKYDKDKFLRIKSHLYLFEDNLYQLIFVDKNNGYLRRKARNCQGIRIINYHKNESITHQMHKEVLYHFKELTLSFNNENVKIYIKRCEAEKYIKCNGSYYEVDLYFELEKTVPESYYKLWNGELFFEIHDTCPVDEKQLIDFTIERKPLFEFTIKNKYKFISDDPNYVSKRCLGIKNNFSKYPVRGVLFDTMFYNNFIYWRISSNKNHYFFANGTRYIVFPNKNNNGYFSIAYGDKHFLNELYGKRFNSLDIAKKNAEYLAYKHYIESNK